MTPLSAFLALHARRTGSTDTPSTAPADRRDRNGTDVEHPPVGQPPPRPWWREAAVLSQHNL